ncbi:MAG: helix-turn-helix domain-containing protein [Pseudomonadota bacterium]
MAEQPVMKDYLYFQAHGLEVEEPAALEAAVRQAMQRLQVGLYTESAQALSDGEVALLRAGGLNPETEAGPDPLTATTADFAALLKTSLSTTEAAARLGVHVSRVRQMLAAELYGFQVNGLWRIPSFQFADKALVPNIGSVNAALDRALHPVAIYRWYTSPDPDLEVEGTALSPLAWLGAGYSPDPVRQIAADL